jgi:uncharacterized protein (TIGR02453 family)
MGFAGFPNEAFEFFEGLAADNSKPYWSANRAVYESAVKGPMQALLQDLESFGPFNIFRPYNDVRFAKGRPPYKEQIGAVGESEGGAVHYVQFSAAGMTAGSGYYSMASDQLERFRRAVDDTGRGTDLAEICAAMERRGHELGAMESLKTAPRGYSKDHPRIELLRRKGLSAFTTWERAPWMNTKSVVKKVRDAWNSAAEMNAWLDTHVGPSTLPPPDWQR